MQNPTPVEKNTLAHDKLTKTQRKIMELYAEGWSVEAIAEKRSRSKSCINTHLDDVCHTLGLERRNLLIIYYYKFYLPEK